jgi:hypothetical protein
MNYTPALCLTPVVCWLRIVVPVLCLVTQGPPVARGMDDMEAAAIIGSGIGEAVGQAISAAQQMQQSAAQASREIEAARRAYWNAVRSRQGVEEARRAFAHQLRGKDFFYMWMALPGGLEGHHFQLLERMAQVDGGVRPSTRFEFREWIKAVRARLGAHDDPMGRQPGTFILPSPAKIAEALEATKPAYEAYIRARDWAELDDSGLTWPWDTDARAHALMILQRYSESHTPEKARETLGQWTEFFGEEHVLAVADRLRVAPRNAMSNLANPGALGLRTSEPHAALIHLLRTRDALTCVKWYLWQEDPGKRSKTAAEAEREFERYIWAYGIEAVEAVGRHVMVPGQYVFPPWRLRSQHPEAKVREVVAFSKDVASKEQVDELHRRLVQKYDKPELLEASDAVFSRRAFSSDPPQQQLRARNLEQLRKKYDGDPYAVLLELLEKGVATTLDGAPRAAEGMAIIYNPNPAAPFKASSGERYHEERAAFHTAIREARPVSLVGIADGVIYGMTEARGLFRMNADGSNFQVLHRFNAFAGGSGGGPEDPDFPRLRLGSDGVLYGALPRVYNEGGRLSPTHVSGALFRLNTDGSKFEYLVNMRQHGISVPHLLMIDEAGTLFGYAEKWQRGRNMVLFHMKRDGSDFQIVSGIPSTDKLVDGRDGHLYGLTVTAGRPRVLELFRVNPKTGDHIMVHKFNTFDQPLHALIAHDIILGSDQRLYGARGARVRDNQGQQVYRRQFFRLNRDGSDFQVIRLEDIPGSNEFKPLLAEGAGGVLYTVTRDPENPKDHENLIGIDKDGQLVATLRTPATDSQSLLAHEGAIFGLDQRHGGSTPGLVYRFSDGDAPPPPRVFQAKSVPSAPR